MTIVIDPEFSVYALVKRVREQSTLLNHRRSMSLISFEIENACLHGNASGRVFSGFQYMSRFLPQAARYQRLAAKAEHVYVFGVPDIQPPPLPNITYVPLRPEDQLAKEWFLVFHGQDYQSALATEELTHISDPDYARRFQGIWSFDLDIVSILEEWLSSAVDAPPLNLTDYNFQRHSEIIAASMTRLFDQFNRQTNLSDTQEIVQNEIKTAIKEGIYPKLESLGGQVQGDEHEVVVLFSDIRNFTGLTERMTPSELVASVVNPHIEAVSQAVYRHGGVIDKFVGDGVLAVFGMDAAHPDNAQRAVQAADEILQTLQDAFPLGIGVARGKVLVGYIGTNRAGERTVIGDAVNIAQRLSALGKNDAWLSHTVVDALPQPPRVYPIGEVMLKGKSESHRVYRLRNAN